MVGVVIVIVFLLQLMTASNLRHYEKDLSSRVIGNYQVLGRIKDPFLLKILSEQPKILTKTKNRRVKALVMDGQEIRPLNISKNPEVKKAIQRSTPIIISRPTKNQVHQITGFEVHSKDAIIIGSNKNGRELIYIR